MKSTSAWAWLTAGVMALGLNGIYQDGGAQWLHEWIGTATDRAAAVVDLASGRADQFFVEARNVSEQSEASSCRVSAAVARIRAAARSQARCPRTQAVLYSRQRGEWIQWQVEQARRNAATARLAATSLRGIDLSNLRVPNMGREIRVFVATPQVRIPEVEMPENSSGPNPI
ncbi:MAG TPA: hypothetical protein VFO39_02835 [Candidatus Sulfotelmatobacter sp.]|nr:hypothetical protein [Candidatus Sulfotelmatobacter sp.]